MQQSSTLSAKFDCPVTRLKFSLLATAHDYKTGLHRCSAATAAAAASANAFDNKFRQGGVLSSIYDIALDQ